MSSYHSKFTYLNKKSDKDLGWVIVHFDADNGETDSYLTQEQIYSDLYDGSRRILYGTKWSTTAQIKITVIKKSGGSFSLSECRSAYKWLTGNPSASWLDLYTDDSLEPKYGFLCTVRDVKPQKLDARTVGLNIYFESISPWAYSPLQTITREFGNDLYVLDDGVLSTLEDGTTLVVDDNGVLSNKEGYAGFVCSIMGTLNLQSKITMDITNPSDDLYSYVYMDVVFESEDGGGFIIENNTLQEYCIVAEVSQYEKVTLSSNHFITSSILNKTFGDYFNYVWPRLQPGVNNFTILVAGKGTLTFTYRYPMKVGDCAIDVNVYGDSLCCESYSGSGSGNDSGVVAWNDIVNTPTTIEGYGITDAYNKRDTDRMFKNISATVDSNKLTAMLDDILK